VASLRRLLSAQSDLADLSGIEIEPFRYEARSTRDGFDPLVEKMIAARAILFATPVYWYAMGGRMKTLFDRFTDLLTDRDDSRRARALAGRDIWMLAVGADPELPAGFDVPFRMTADYLALRWQGSAYLASNEAQASRRQKLARFAALIDASLGSSPSARGDHGGSS
jgi:putative NADPH-quinone reductase